MGISLNYSIVVLHEGFTKNILETPGSIASSTPSGTPFRDQLNINQEPVGANLDDLRKQLRTLPKPKNDFEIVLPEEETALDESTEVSFRFLKLYVFKKSTMFCFRNGLKTLLSLMNVEHNFWPKNESRN